MNGNGNLNYEAMKSVCSNLLLDYAGKDDSPSLIVSTEYIESTHRFLCDELGKHSILKRIICPYSIRNLPCNRILFEDVEKCPFRSEKK
jgi:hypothetical protein